MLSSFLYREKARPLDRAPDVGMQLLAMSFRLWRLLFCAGAAQVSAKAGEKASHFVGLGASAPLTRRGVHGVKHAVHKLPQATEAAAFVVGQGATLYCLAQKGSLMLQ